MATTGSGRMRTAARTAGALFDSVWRAPRGPSPVQVVGRGAAPPLEPGRPFTLLVWNVQFCAGRSREFFYDGGDAVHAEPGDVTRTLDRVAGVLREQQADVVLLQEVDRASARTGFVDQHAEILARTPFPCHASTPYHDNRYVPYPPQQHLGRVGVHLSALSRFSMAEGTRWPLPPLAEPWIRRQFNFRRALLELSLPLTDGRTLGLFDVHLSAFSRGSGTLARQIAAVTELVDRTARFGRPVVLGGDFNALPPGDDPKRLGAGAVEYEAEPDALAPLFERYGSAIPLEAHRDEPERWRTWVPFGADEAERAIDHAFVAGVEVLDAAVLSGVTDASDHLPLRVELVVPPR
jgi:endonuclease/exonuclease/phosphatase family metal-dependent hydrolase